MKRGNKKRIALIAIILFVLIIYIWYRIPVKKYVSMSLCSVDGERLDVVFDVDWNRYLLKPSELKGTLIFNGKEYHSIMDTKYEFERDGLLENLTKKISGDEWMPFFIIPTNDAFDVHQHNIQLFNFDEDFDTVCMGVIQDSSITVYYGPAETTEEANEIMSRLK